MYHLTKEKAKEETKNGEFFVKKESPAHGRLFAYKNPLYAGSETVTVVPTFGTDSSLMLPW